MANTQKPRLQSQVSRIDWRLMVASPWTLALAISCLLFAILLVSRQRTIFGIGVESDFTGIFGREAQRILLGESLLLHYHPPGYAFAAAVGRVISGDWLDGALWISGISAMIFMVASIVTYRKLAGTAASWGALVAFACSTPFLVAASIASSDMMFVALVYVLFALVVHALDSPNRVLLWLGCGAAAAFVLLTRTNGLPVAAVIVLPFLVPSQVASRARNLAAVAVGLSLPMLAWAVYATGTDSPLLPVSNHLNLAVAAYGQGPGKWGEKLAYFQANMQNIADVLTYDPVQLASQLIRNLALLPFKAVLTLTWLPLALLAVPGLILMLRKYRTPAFLVCLALITGMTMLSGILDYVARYHLVLIPLLGAMAGTAFTYALDRFAGGQTQRVLLTVVALLAVGVASARAYALVLPILETSVQLEFSEAIPQVLRQTEADATIVARNPNLTFETGRRTGKLVNVGTATLLRRELCRELDRARPAYLFIGEMERRYRSDLDRELSSRPVPWLEPVARGAKTRWTLYRIRLDRPDDCHDRAS